MVENVPESVERLLLQDVESYEQLEVLLFLFEHPREPFAAKAVADSLRMSEEAASTALDHLTQRGLLVSTETADPATFEYGALPSELDATIRTLRRIYREKPAQIAKRMTANAIERVRTAAIRTFSDAFLLRGKKDDG